MKKIDKTRKIKEIKIIIGVLILFLMAGLLLIVNKTNRDTAVKELINETVVSKNKSSDGMPSGVVQESLALSLNEAQRNFDELSFRISPNGKSFAYINTNKELDQRTVVLNGEPSTPYNDVIFMNFSDNSQHFAYGAKVDGGSFVVLDGQAGKIYDWLLEPRFFTPDNKYFVYKARDDRGDILVFNNQESRPYERIYNVTINKEQTELIFYARRNNQILKGTFSLK